MNDNAIRRIQVGDLRKMSDREGLILQGAAVIRRSGWMGSTKCSRMLEPAQWQPV